MILERSGILEAGLTALAEIWAHLGVDSNNVAEQAGGLEELLDALVALVQLLLVVHLPHVPV
jgi:hypothetical protein